MISSSLFMVEVALIALCVILLRAGLGPLGALAEVIALILAALGFLVGIIGVTKLKAAAVVGLLGNLVIGALVLVEFGMARGV